MEKRQEYQIRKLSKLTGKMNIMAIWLTPAEFKRVLAWNRGKGPDIQDVLPTHTPAEREFLRSGLSLEEQKEMLGCEQQLQSNTSS